MRGKMNEIHDILSVFGSKVDNCDDYELYYRGFINCGWKDVPSVFRNDRLKRENLFVEQVVCNYPDVFSNAHTIDILTQLQHYGCPTRMLDVTSNFLVALFFACGGWEQVVDRKIFEENEYTDGLIRIYTVKKDKIKSIDSETVTLIANISRLEYTGKPFGELPWKCERDLGVWQTDDDLILKNAEDANDVVFVKTQLNNPRVRAQFGSFFLFGGLSKIEGIKHPDWLKQQIVTKKKIDMPHEYVMDEIKISAKHKKKILDDLKTFFGMSFQTLCPEKQDFIKTIANY